VVLGVVDSMTEITIAMESKMKYILMIIMLSLSTQICASGNKTVHTTNNTYTSIEDARGVAIAIASAQHNFDYGTYSWQGSVGVGMYKEEEAVSFGVAKRVGKVLMNGSATPDSVGVGVNWRW